jgi:hypothetical protein
MLFALSGCSRYELTLNEQPIYKPASLFNDFSLPDQGLHNCIAQTIQDKEITSPDQLTQLNCSQAGITNLEGIELFSQIVTLNLSDNNVTDLRPLLFLGNLTNLNLAQNKQAQCTYVDQLRNSLSGQTIFPEQCEP